MSCACFSVCVFEAAQYSFGVWVIFSSRLSPPSVIMSLVFRFCAVSRIFPQSSYCPNVVRACVFPYSMIRSCSSWSRALW